MKRRDGGEDARRAPVVAAHALRAFPMRGPRAFVTRGLAAFAAFISLALCGAPAVQAQEEPSRGGFFDLDYFRFYGAVGVGMATTTTPDLIDGISNSGISDLYDGSIGFDLGRNFGFEIAFNLYEFDVVAAERGVIGETSIYTIIPHLRFRFPLLRDRLVPFAVVGAGVGWSEFNDPTPAAGDPLLLEVENERDLVGSLGIGIDYFVARNVALGLAARYILQESAVTQGDQLFQTRTDGALFSAALRVFFPETPPADAFRGVRWRSTDPDGIRPYLAFRFGGKTYSDQGFTGDHRLANAGEQVNGGSIGVDLSRYFGVELAVENHDTHVRAAAGFKSAEFAVWNVVPQLRVRYPLFKHRLTPYGVVGLGVGLGQINDPTPQNQPDSGPVLSGGSWSMILGAGGGLDFAIAQNVALLGEAKWVQQSYAPSVDGVPREVEASTFLLTFGFRVFFL